MVQVSAISLAETLVCPAPAVSASESIRWTAPRIYPLTTVVPLWYLSSQEGNTVMKKRKTKADIVQSTLRLPRAIWRRITQRAALKNLSMQQAVQEAIVEYCRREEEAEKGGKS